MGFIPEAAGISDPDWTYWNWRRPREGLRDYWVCLHQFQKVPTASYFGTTVAMTEFHSRSPNLLRCIVVSCPRVGTDGEEIYENLNKNLSAALEENQNRAAKKGFLSGWDEEA